MGDSQANEAVRSMLEDLVAGGEELGLQVAAYHKGNLVIDAWAGIADARSGRKVDGETLFTVFSTTKGILYTAIHLLADRRLLDYDDPVSRYWPAFAARGKQDVTIRQVLTHTAGVPQMPEGATPEDICAWERICAAIADLPLLWKPGAMTGYHAFTIGWILGEVLHRVDGRSVSRFVSEEICRPLGLRNLFLGIPEEVEERVAFLEDAPPPADAPEPRPLSFKAVPANLPASAALFNRPEVRRASIPAAGGIMNARDLARHYACLATGVDGVRLVSAQRVALVAKEQTCDLDQVIGLNIRKGLGYFLHGENGESISESPDSFGHPGAGGSVGFADPAHALAVGLTKTRLTAPADRNTGSDVKVTARIREALGIA
ncbi:MAG: beta-lactamase family protein [Spirochaetales bacterium]|nr:beta-lactamase family protein [Spirochaetales bacterium]